MRTIPALVVKEYCQHVRTHVAIVNARLFLDRTKVPHLGAGVYLELVE